MRIYEKNNKIQRAAWSNTEVHKQSESENCNLFMIIAHCGECFFIIQFIVEILLYSNQITHSLIVHLIYSPFQFDQLMQHQPSSIYQQLLSPTPALIDRLMGVDGEALLDQQILKMRDQIGEQEFHQYAIDFFKNSQIDYKTFFKIANPNGLSSSAPLTIIQPNQQEQQIIEKAEPQQKHPQQPNLQVIQVEPEEYTNNSQEFNDEFQQIQKTQLGNNRFLIRYKNGDSYEGEMQGGIKSGWGDYHYQSGQTYSGCFIDDQINGYGRYYFLSGAQYQGDWSSGMKHGIGILKFANKDIYEGEFARDDLHGKGKYRYNNGDHFEGQFYQGKRHGNGCFQGADGRYQKGVWVNDNFQV